MHGSLAAAVNALRIEEKLVKERGHANQYANYLVSMRLMNENADDCKYFAPPRSRRCLVSAARMKRRRRALGSPIISFDRGDARPRGAEEGEAAARKAEEAAKHNREKAERAAAAAGGGRHRARGRDPPGGAAVRLAAAASAGRWRMRSCGWRS